MKKLIVSLALVGAATSVSATYNGFTLKRVESTNGGYVCVYSNGQHTIKQFRSYAMGYCPHDMPM